jgi:hypothetical protein
MVKIITSDNIEFVVEKSCVYKSKFIRNMLELFTDMEEQPIEIKNINGDIMKHIIEYTTHYSVEKDYLDNRTDEQVKKDDDEENKDAEIIEVFNDWDKEFLSKFDNDKTMDILLGANFLDIKNLVLICTQKLANYINSNLTVSDDNVTELNVKNFLGIPLDMVTEYTEEDEVVTA